uniref:ANK_REP_REGION domain-containing protein n=1 Tax=Macrostomum lignano TaxID=282301 RepID=A0A1I8FJB3_9PLAT
MRAERDESGRQPGLMPNPNSPNFARAFRNFADENGRLAGRPPLLRLLRDDWTPPESAWLPLAKLESEVERLAGSDKTGRVRLSCLAMRRRLAELGRGAGRLRGSHGGEDSPAAGASSAAFASPTRSSPHPWTLPGRVLAELTRTNSELEAAAAAAASASSSSFPSATVPPMPDGVGESLADCLRADAQAEAALADERFRLPTSTTRCGVSGGRSLRQALRIDAAVWSGSWSWRNTATAGKVEADAAEIQRLTADCARAPRPRRPAAQQQLEDLELAHDRLRQESDRQTPVPALLRLPRCVRQPPRPLTLAPLPTKKPGSHCVEVADAATAAAEASATEAASARDEATSLKAQLAELDCSAASCTSVRLWLVRSVDRLPTPGATVAALESRIESIQTEMEQARTRLEAEEEARRRAELQSLVSEASSPACTRWTRTTPGCQLTMTSPAAVCTRTLAAELDLKERDAEARTTIGVKLKDSSICRRRCRARLRIWLRILEEKESALAETNLKLAKLRNLLSERRSYRASPRCVMLVAQNQDLIAAVNNNNSSNSSGIATTAEASGGRANHDRSLSQERQLREMLASLPEAQKSIGGADDVQSSERQRSAEAEFQQLAATNSRDPSARVIDAAAAASASAFKSSSWSERCWGGASSGDQPPKPPTRG